MWHRKLAIAAASAAALLSLSSVASASLVYDAKISVAGQGFGSAPRDLTLQATGNDTFESGGLGWNGTSIMFGTVLANESQVFLANGVTNQSGTTSLPNPLVDDNKYGVPTTGSLEITTASQIGILFNATEPGTAGGVGNSINVLDITLKFFSSGGTLLGAIDGNQNFPDTVSGNGSAGFTFVVAQDQQAYVNGLLLQGGRTTRLALEARLGDFAAGPDTFLIYNLGGGVTAPIPEPETYALMLAGLGLVGFMARRRKRAD